MVIWFVIIKKGKFVEYRVLMITNTNKLYTRVC